VYIYTTEELYEMMAEHLAGKRPELTEWFLISYRQRVGALPHEFKHSRTVNDIVLTRYFVAV